MKVGLLDEIALLAACYNKSVNAGKLFSAGHHGRKLRNERVKRMALTEEFLAILACPACRAKLELKADQSALKCVGCRRVYPIRDDIPCLLVDQATIEDEQPAGNS
jgi:uncharacterized protein YbaR (Trm112 family)